MKKRFPLWHRLAAWGVHLFTASGLLAGFAALLAVRDHAWQEVAVWLLIALFIDGVDGTFARRLRVAEVLPAINGKYIDFVIDFFNYAIVPAYMLYESDLLLDGHRDFAVALVLLVSAIYYGIEEMVSPDHYFLGFPVMWNVAILYLLFVLQASPLINLVLILLLCVLHFVPIKFAYPSRNSHARVPSLLATVAFIAALLTAVYFYPHPPVWLVWSAHATVLYFAGLAVYDTWGRNPGGS